MTQPDRIVLVITDLVIDDAKASYIETAKAVTPADVLEVLSLEPRFFVQQTDRGERFSMLGPNHRGRFLVVALAPVEAEGKWRLVTAYWIRRARGRRIYESGGDV